MKVNEQELAQWTEVAIDAGNLLKELAETGATLSSTDNEYVAIMATIRQLLSSIG